MTKWGPITGAEAQAELRQSLEPLLGTSVDHLRIPADIAPQIEPSQIGTIVGTLTDLILPRLALEKNIGLHKAAGLLGDREGYPDFEHDDGYRLELKGTFTDNPKIRLKTPPTPREPSARLTQKVTMKNVVSNTDGLLVLVYQLEHLAGREDLLSPTIKGVGVFPVIECVKARDMRMEQAGGRWFGDYETPTVVSKAGRIATRDGTLNTSQYGRKESECWHFNEDTNFGKLKRIPYKPLQLFLRESGCKYAATGCYPEPWSLGKVSPQEELAFEVREEQSP